MTPVSILLYISQHPLLRYKKSQESLLELDKNIDSLKSPHKISNTADTSFNNQVYFLDRVGGNYIKLGLSDENMLSLKNKFDANNFYSRDDGSTILNGEAEALISGWFADIAYKREYLSADNNQDGILNKEEKANTKSAFKESGIYEINNGKVVFAKTMTLKTYQKSDNVNENFTSHSIEAELNNTLSKDKNLDGILAYNEALSNSERINTIKNLISEDIKNINNSNSQNNQDSNPLSEFSKQGIKTILQLNCKSKTTNKAKVLQQKQKPKY